VGEWGAGDDMGILFLGSSGSGYFVLIQ